MKINSIIITVISTLVTQQLIAQSTLAIGFDHPQDTARTKVWWFHGETIGTHEGITADLEAFKEQGVGGVVYYDQVHGNGDGAFHVFSPEWWDELIFSSQEARRIGLNFECNVSNGYVAGGKWITPDKSMQRLTSTEMVVEGGRDLYFKMPMVKAPGNWHSDVALIALPYQESLMDDSRSVFDADSVIRLSNPHQPTHIDIDFGRTFTARSITYIVGARAKARTSSMQVPPTHFTLNPELPSINPQEFYGCGFRTLPPIGELQVSQDGESYQTVCSLRPKYRSMGGIKEQTVSFPTVKGRYFRIILHDWGTDNPSDNALTFGNIVISARASVDAWQEKASLIPEIIEGDKTPKYESNELMDFSQAIDLTNMIDADGNVTWEKAPKGKWLVLRFFSISTGGRSKHGRADALGLECDKLSTNGALLQWNSYVKPIIDSIRSHQGLLTGICMDSHEAGPQNWTVGFEREFNNLRGYDIRHFLPVMAGMIVDSAEKSIQFLNDLRHTINDLVTDRYYGEFNRLCHTEGLTLTAQAIGGALCMTGDAISVKRLIDKPQGEFWAYQTEGNYDIKDCSSAAHLYCKQIASGEAFTDATYKQTLADIKNLADYAYCYGINELVVCASAYQPWVRKDHEPLRISTANGRQYVLNRLNTFWQMSRPFWDYQARCSWMLRQGKPVGDICLYLGDDIPMRTLSHKLPDIPQGYNFDSFTTHALLNRMTVKDRRIILPDGVSYRMMVLPPDGQIPVQARQKIETFQQLGVPIYDPQHDHHTLAEVIREATLSPDVDCPSSQSLYFCHRRTDQEDIYFLNNHSDIEITDCFRFNVSASNAALWNPVTGEKTVLNVKHESDRTAVDLTLAPRQSYFIIFNNHPLEPAHQHRVSSMQTLLSPWTVTFDSQMGGPTEPVTFDKLTDWTVNDNPQIKYFSGTAICKSMFRMDKINKNSIYKLTLPLLNTVAEVIVNGESVGILWCSPHQIDITRMLKKGNNHIELRMANSLWNRLVGDALLTESERVTWQTDMLAKPTDSLVPSGINGDIIIGEYK